MWVEYYYFGITLINKYYTKCLIYRDFALDPDPTSFENTDLGPTFFRNTDLDPTKTPTDPVPQPSLKLQWRDLNACEHAHDEDGEAGDRPGRGGPERLALPYWYFEIRL